MVVVTHILISMVDEEVDMMMDTTIGEEEVVDIMIIEVTIEVITTMTEEVAITVAAGEVVVIIEIMEVTVAGMTEIIDQETTTDIMIVVVVVGREKKLLKINYCVMLRVNTNHFNVIETSQLGNMILRNFQSYYLQPFYLALLFLLCVA